MSPRASNQLPAGRHGLPRDFVWENQHDRMLAATASVAATAGYGHLSVENVIVVAGVSRRTFYDHFTDMDAAFLAAYQRVADEFVAVVQNARQPGMTPEEGAVAILRAAVTFLSERPEEGDLLLVHAHAASRDVVESRDALIEEMVLLAEDTASVCGVPPRPRIISEIAVGAIQEALYTRALRGQHDTLPGLVPDLTYAATLFHLGPERAAAARALALRTARKPVPVQPPSAASRS